MISKWNARPSMEKFRKLSKLMGSRQGHYLSRKGKRFKRFTWPIVCYVWSKCWLSPKTLILTDLFSFLPDWFFINRFNHAANCCQNMFSIKLKCVFSWSMRNNSFCSSTSYRSKVHKLWWVNECNKVVC